MSEYRTVVTAGWPFAPLGVKVTVEVPETYELDENVANPLKELLADLRAETTLGRFIQIFILPVLRKFGIVGK